MTISFDGCRHDHSRVTNEGQFCLDCRTWLFRFTTSKPHRRDGHDPEQRPTPPNVTRQWFEVNGDKCEYAWVTSQPGQLEFIEIVWTE